MDHLTNTYLMRSRGLNGEVTEDCNWNQILKEGQVKIAHYDIKPANVLFIANFSSKVADFRSASLLCNRKNYHVTITGGSGAPGNAESEIWMPLPVTRKCHVSSFGILLSEILGRRNLDTQA
ncbi:rust resistance kinase Lr10-like [Phoenix dactylifera]|uniref:Rust resistance kinase Lr10-like n=1 Tax=Phoenix dactylifera TaxID=42345 RepID=A0A8B7BHJ0_PHODC|nr:rust resistance kinase Lr10-like [Phoenix dactylifera]